jgi:KDO2-lipid IV(A) lauroyltransferase
MEYGEITKAHTRLLEAEIIKVPAYWLWSHKRWKHTRPEGEVMND